MVRLPYVGNNGRSMKNLFAVGPHHQDSSQACALVRHGRIDARLTGRSARRFSWICEFDLRCAQQPASRRKFASMMARERAEHPVPGNQTQRAQYLRLKVFAQNK